jgi:hypothetical protein
MEEGCFYNMLTNLFCCKELDQHANDLRIPLNYSSRFREYYLNFCSNSKIVQLITFCPWCGSELPKSLRNEYFDILESECDLENCLDVEAVPEEFKTDEWWRARKL